MWMWTKSRQERGTDLALAWVQTVRLWTELRKITGELSDEDRSFVEAQLTKSADVMLGKDTAGLAGFKSKRERVVEEALARLRMSKALSDLSALTGGLAHDRQRLSSELDETVERFRSIA